MPYMPESTFIHPVREFVRFKERRGRTGERDGSLEDIEKEA
jgi:hypothetical protein